MTTSYSKNIHLSNLLVHIAHSSFMSISFFLHEHCLIPPISSIIDHYCIIENLKKSGKNKNKLRTIYPKNHEIFKNSKPRVQFL